MILEKMIIKNFLSVKELEFEFKPGFHLITGVNLCSDEISSNGSGKSSLIEPVPWAYFKFTERDEISSDGVGDSMVAITSIHGKERYTVTRYRNDTKQGNNVTIQKDGGDVSTPNIRIANKEIEDLLGIPQQVFLSSIIIPQGTPFNFTQLGPTERKMLLEEITGFIWWDQVRPKFTSRLDTIKQESNVISQKIQGLESSITNTLNSIEELNKKSTVVSPDDSRMEEVTNSIIDINKNISSCETEIDAILGGSEITSLKDRERFLDKEKINLLSDKRNQEALVNDEKCPTCGQVYPEEYLMIAKMRIEELSSLLGSVERKLTLVTDIVAKHRIQSDKLRNLNTDRNLKRSTLNEIKLSRTKVEENQDVLINSLMDSVKATRKEIESLTPSLGKLSRSVNVLTNINNELLPSSEFRTNTLNRFIDVINTTISDICLSVDNNFVVTLVPEKKGIGFNITRGSKVINYKNLSGGEKRRIDIIILLAIQKYFLEMSGTTCNLVVFDEIFDNIDSVGIKIIIETIKNMFDESTCVLVVTHNDLVKSSFDSIITVTKGIDGVSQFDFSEYR